MLPVLDQLVDLVRNFPDEFFRKRFQVGYVAKRLRLVVRRGDRDQARRPSAAGMR
jgi:hypothetical protein